MTDLEIFTKSASHLIKQGKQSMGTDWNFLYITANGEMCAIGCLINPTAYHKTIESVEVDFESDLPRNKRLRTILTQSGISLNKKTYELLRLLQKCHDGNEPEKWEKELIKIHSNFFNKSVEDSTKFMERLKGNIQ